jgi:hypothetical protein
MKTLKLIKTIFALTLILYITVSCKSDDEEQEPINTTFEGIFLDAPVQGLSYISSTTNGKTDPNGTFKYQDNETISFNVGGILIGEALGKEQITPLDLANADINNQQVRNIASFLQSLDSDNNPSNGIVINEATNQALNNETLDFNSDNFFLELTELINRINATNSSSLIIVSTNDAAAHLADTLNLQNEFEFLPRVFQGREWEEGEYFVYNTAGSNKEYILKIGSDLNGVKYHFGGNTGYYMDMVYEQNKLSGLGNIYTDLNENPPTNSSPDYDYRNRITSPGFALDYQNNTYMGYYNYFKKEGELDKLQGAYESFFYYDQKRVNQEPEILFVQKIEVIISDANNNGDFPTQIITHDVDDNIINDVSIIINKEEINKENIVLVRFQETDHLFVNQDLLGTSSYFFPGLFLIKQ